MESARAESLIVTAEDARAAMRRGENAEGVEAFEATYDDMCEALDWLLQIGRADDAFRLSAAMTQFWMASKHVDEGKTWLEGALETGQGSDAVVPAASTTSATSPSSPAATTSPRVGSPSLATGRAGRGPERHHPGPGRLGARPAQRRPGGLGRPPPGGDGDHAGHAGQPWPVERRACPGRCAPAIGRSRGRPRRHGRAAAPRPRDRQRLRRLRRSVQLEHGRAQAQQPRHGRGTIARGPPHRRPPTTRWRSRGSSTASPR